MPVNVRDALRFASKDSGRTGHAGATTSPLASQSLTRQRNLHQSAGLPKAQRTCWNILTMEFHLRFRKCSNGIEAHQGFRDCWNIDQHHCAKECSRAGAPISFKRLPAARVHVPRLLWSLHEGLQMSKRARDRGDKRDRWREPINHPEPR